MSNELNNYKHFVDTLTSNPSKNKEDFLKSIETLYDNGMDVSRLLTGAIGLSAEAGELTEIVKKQLFQGKPYNEENRFHIKRELGDVIFYWINTAIAIGEDPMEIINENIRKLESRYPGGSFNIQNSEHRKEGDL